MFVRSNLIRGIKPESRDRTLGEPLDGWLSFPLVVLNVSFDAVVEKSDKDINAPGMSHSSYQLLSHQ